MSAQSEEFSLSFPNSNSNEQNTSQPFEPEYTKTRHCERQAAVLLLLVMFKFD